MISKKVMNELWNMGYAPSEKGCVEVVSDQAQSYYKIVHEESGDLVLYGGVSKEAFVVKLKDLEWSRSLQRPDSNYNGLYPRNSNGNWPKVVPDIRKEKPRTSVRKQPKEDKV
jgi:hypothetical protein